ncbi:MAG: hypothetical protein ACLRW4_00215 [Ruminococcus sp.]
MKEEQLQKNSVFAVKTDCILLITALIASILFLISPFAVSAQEGDVENTETVFEDETETVPDMNRDPDFDSDPASNLDSTPDPDLGGFISGDDSSPKIIPFMLLLKMDLAIQTAVMQSLPVMMLWVSEILLMERICMPRRVQTEVIPPEKRFSTSLSCYWKTVIFPARH